MPAQNDIKTSTARPQPKNEKEPIPDHIVAFSNELARMVMHPQTPKKIKSALQAVIVNTISNTGGYAWHEDEEAISFLLPRYLHSMSESYALGIVHTLGEIIHDSIPGIGYNPYPPVGGDEE